jgi:hypothetical protein
MYSPQLLEKNVTAIYISNGKKKGYTVNIVSGMTRFKFSGAMISLVIALNNSKESGVSGSWTCGVDFLDFDFESIFIDTIQIKKFLRVPGRNRERDRAIVGFGFHTVEWRL